MLPAASAAYPEMLAARSLPDSRRLDHALYMPLGITAFLAVELYIRHISGSPERHKHHHIVDTRQSIPLCRHINYLHPLKHREFLTFSAHL